MPLLSRSGQPHAPMALMAKLHVQSDQLQPAWTYAWFLSCLPAWAISTTLFKGDQEGGHAHVLAFVASHPGATVLT